VATPIPIIIITKQDAQGLRLINQWLPSLRSWHVACPKEQRVSALVSGMSVWIEKIGRRMDTGSISARIEQFIHRTRTPVDMAAKRTDSFFIRSAVATTTDAQWSTAEIDLGSFVDALGEHVLRIWNLRVKYQDDGTNGPPMPGNLGVQGGSAYLSYVLTTQPLASDTAVLDLSDKSIVASGQWTWVSNGPEPATLTGLTTNYAVITDSTDIAPQDWERGYLIGVDTLYLSIYQDAEMGPDENRVSVVMECQSEKLTKAGAMALALSQS